jgi:hypothetical protein
MRALRLLLVSALACGALLAFAPSSGAAVPAVPSASKTCSVYNQLTKDLANADTSSAKKFDASTFKKIGAAFKKAAKSAPPKVKTAMNTLASYYGTIGGSDNDAEAFAEISKNGEKFSKAITTFTTYYATNCN